MPAVRQSNDGRAIRKTKTKRNRNSPILELQKTITAEPDSSSKRVFTPKTLNQQRYFESIQTNKLTFGVGPSGVGKTRIIAHCGVNMLINKQVDKIILTRPCQESGEKLGAMPGGLMDKINFYMTPLLMEFYKEVGRGQVDLWLRTKQIEIVPLAFMRGYNFDNVFAALDEGQNATKIQMKMFLTRACENCRMVVDGDSTQVDIQSHSSGLDDAIRRMDGDPEVGIVRFIPEDIVRSGLVRRIVENYDKP